MYRGFGPRPVILPLLAALLVGSTASADVSLRRGQSGALRLSSAAKGPTPNVFAAPQIRFDSPTLRRRLLKQYLARRRSNGSGATKYDDLIREISGRHGIDYTLVKAVIKTESNFNARAVSPKGARGLMQLMPATARQHSVRNIHSPRDNIEGGVRHLRMLLDRYRGNVTLALAAYNAGIGAVERYGRRIPPYRETRQYVPRVLSHRVAYRRDAILARAAEQQPN